MIHETMNLLPHDIDNEILLLKRLVYKNVNQHRRAKYFRDIRQSFSVIKQLLQDEDHAVFAKLEEAAQVLESISNTTSLKLLVGRKITITEVLKRWIMQFSSKRQVIVNCHHSVSELLSQGYFIPFASTVVAIIAKFLYMQRLCHLTTEGSFTKYNDMAERMLKDHQLPTTIINQTLELKRDFRIQVDSDDKPRSEEDDDVLDIGQVVSRDSVLLAKGVGESKSAVASTIRSELHPATAPPSSSSSDNLKAKLPVFSMPSLSSKAVTSSSSIRNKRPSTEEGTPKPFKKQRFSNSELPSQSSSSTSKKKQKKKLKVKKKSKKGNTFIDDIFKDFL